MDLGLLEKRILNRESFPAGASIEKCAKAFHKLKSTATDDSEKEYFLRELYSYKLDMGILEKSLGVCDVEIENYVFREREMDEKIAEASNDIVALNSELQQEKIIRASRENCEAIAQSVIALPTRSSMKRKVSDIEIEVKKVQEVIGIFESRIENRRKEFHGIMDLLETMQTALAEDMRVDLEKEGALGDDDDEEEVVKRDSTRAREGTGGSSSAGGGKDDFEFDDENGGGNGNGSGGSTYLVTSEEHGVVNDAEEEEEGEILSG
jgi:hypothetical protein